MVSDTIGVLFHLAVLVLFKLENKPDVVVAIAGGDMQMEMEDGLPRNAAVVREDIKSLEVKTPDERACDDSRSLQQRQITSRIKLQEIPIMAPGDDEGVAQMDWVDIKNGNDPIVFEEYFGRNLTCNDVAEDAIVHEAGT